MNAGSGSQVWLRKPNVSTIARTNGARAGRRRLSPHRRDEERPGAGAAKIYIDGVPVASSTSSPAAGRLVNDRRAGVRRGPASNQADFDEFALYDPVLTPERVQAHHSAGIGGAT